MAINPTYIDDVAAAVEAALSVTSPMLLNVAGDETATIADLVALMGRLAGSETHVSHIEPGPPGDLVGDNSRMKEALGVAPRTALSEGIHALLREIRQS